MVSLFDGGSDWFEQDVIKQSVRPSVKPWQDNGRTASVIRPRRIKIRSKALFELMTE